MSASKLQTIRLLNGLRLIHIERINGYNKALSLLSTGTTKKDKDVQLASLLSESVRESIFLSATLENIVLIEGGKMPYGIKVDQQLYNVIRSLKTMFQEMDQHSLFSVCSQCENDLQEAYNIVLNETGLATDPKDILFTQQQNLRKSKDFIEAMTRDAVSNYTVAA